MTNGEMIKSIFPSAEIDIGNGGNDIWIAIDCWTIFKKEWWNAEYKEPTTKNYLGVDREQLKTMIRGLTKWYVKRDNTEVGEPNTAVGLLYDDVMFGIDRLPSATPQEPRKGHWTIDRANVRCSCCGKGYKDFYGKARIASYNYCPNCGAKMVEPQESEDKE